MSKQKRLGAGLAGLVTIVLFAAWYGVARGRPAGPDVELPPDTAGCVEPAAYMIANHPALLNEWRNAVVRKGATTYTSSTGKTYEISLTGTCMQCHQNRATFCQRCHDYADVHETCWNCHVEPGK